MHATQCKPEEGSMLIRQRTTYEFRTCGAHISKDMSALSRLRCAWRYSKSHDQWNLESLMIITLMPRLTSQYRENSQRWTGISMSVTRNTDYTRWCDVCKAAWYDKNKPQNRSKIKIASWVVTGSQGRSSYYCGDCAADVTHWNCDCDNPRGCSNRFSLEEQVKGKLPPKLEMSNHGF